MPGWKVSEENPTLVSIHLACLALCFVAVGASIPLILKHLRHFSQPVIQRKIVAILWMVPVYSTTSWLSLRFVRYSIYFDILRDCYESYVIYMFFALCYCYIGQLSRNSVDRSRIHAVLAERGSIQHLVSFPTWTGIENEIDLASDPRKFLMSCKQNILQFVIMKPLSAIAVIILTLYFDNYETGNFSLTNGYIYVTTIVNVSISLSMYYLILFYQATKDSLTPFNPVPKFLCIKGVLFFSYWQSVIITILVKLGIITEIPVINYSVEFVASTVQNVLICVEMVGFAISHHYAFSADPFYFIPTRFNSDLQIEQPLVQNASDQQQPNRSTRVPLRTSARAMFRNAVDFSDVVNDFQEVAPEMPIVRYLRRNSASAVEAGINNPDNLINIPPPNQGKRNISDLPPRPTST
jgi:hypothetical protein